MSRAEIAPSLSSIAVSMSESVNPLTPKPNSARFARSVAASRSSRTSAATYGASSSRTRAVRVGEQVLAVPECVVAVERHDVDPG